MKKKTQTHNILDTCSGTTLCSRRNRPGDASLCQSAGHRNAVDYRTGTFGKFDSFTSVTLSHVLNASSTSAMKGAKSLYAMDMSPFRLSASPPCRSQPPQRNKTEKQHDVRAVRGDRKMDVPPTCRPRFLRRELASLKAMRPRRLRGCPDALAKVHAARLGMLYKAHSSTAPRPAKYGQEFVGSCRFSSCERFHREKNRSHGLISIRLGRICREGWGSSACHRSHEKALTVSPRQRDSCWAKARLMLSINCAARAGL